MLLFKSSTVILLASLCFLFNRVSASALGSIGDGYKLSQTNRRVFVPSKDMKGDSTGLDKKAKARRVWPATIEFSAFGVATLYINGIIYSKLFSPHPWKMTVNLARGDVVALKAEKTGIHTGVMVTIGWKGRKIRSGRDVFKVRSDNYYSWKPAEQDSWNRVARDSNGILESSTSFCSWKDADVVKMRKPRFDKKAKFIWSLRESHEHGEVNKTPAQTVYIRYVMGGERCGKDSHTKKMKTNKEGKSGVSTDHEDEKNVKSSGDDDDGAGQKQNKSIGGNDRDTANSRVGGQSDTRFCKCRISTLRGGTCFDMVTPGDDEGPCTARPCEPRYECVQDGETMCFMRRMITRVVMTGVRSCKRISSETDLLVPYKR